MRTRWGLHQTMCLSELNHGLAMCNDARGLRDGGASLSRPTTICTKGEKKKHPGFHHRTYIPFPGYAGSYTASRLYFNYTPRVCSLQPSASVCTYVVPPFNLSLRARGGLRSPPIVSNNYSAISKKSYACLHVSMQYEIAQEMCQPATTKSCMILGFWLLNANLLLIINKKCKKKNS